MKRVYLVLISLCFGLNFFACSNIEQNNNLTDNNLGISQTTLDPMVMQSINTYRPYFSCSFGVYEDNPVFTQVTVKNISPFKFEDLFLTVVFLNQNNEEVRTETMGVYSNVFNDDEMKIYLRDFEPEIKTAYVIDAVQNYFT